MDHSPPFIKKNSLKINILESFPDATLYRFSMRSTVIPLFISALLFAMPHQGIAERFILQNPVQTRYTIRSIAFADAMHGIAVGDAGTILSTVDGGVHWKQQPSGTSTALYSVSMPNERYAVVVGSQGTILQSSDGGAVWNRRSSGSLNELFSVSMTDSLNGVIVGLTVVDVESAILVTTDGGKVWKAKASGKKRNLRNVAMVSKRAGVAVGIRGAIITTDDGGEQWNTSATIPLCGACNRNKYVRVAMATPAVGYAALESGEIVKTIDGGKSWRLCASQGADVQALAFLSADTGAVARENSVWFTYDGGATWKERSVSTNSRDEITTLCWLPSGVLFIGGVNGFLARSANGISFEKISGITNSTFLSIAMRPSGRGVVTTEVGKILRTTNHGAVWTITSPHLDESRIVDAAFASDSLVCAITENGVILRSTDAGAQWKQMFVPVVPDVKKIVLSSSGLGFCVGMQGAILRTTDAGITWNNVFPGTAENLLDVAISDVNGSRWVVALAEGGKIFTSADGGINWQSLETRIKLSRLALDRSSSWIAAGEKILRSTDKGKTWIDMGVAIPFPVNALAMDAGGYGILVGTRGRYVVTTDGGVSWKENKIPYDDALTDVAMVSSTEWIAVGANALIVRHAQGKLSFERDTFFVDERMASQNSEQKIIARNTGSEDVLISSITFDDGSLATLRNASGMLPLEPGDSLAIRFRVKPHEAGRLKDMLIVESDGPEAIQNIVIVESQMLTTVVPTKRRNPVVLPKEDYFFSVYPNPVTSDLTIRFMLTSAQEIRLELLDALGRRVMAIDDAYHREGEFVFRRDLEGLPRGMYLLRMIHHAGAEMKRIVYVPSQ